MFDLVSNNPMITTMDRSMTLASQRMALIASNLANIDTPGYRTRDFDFQAALKRALDQQDGKNMPMLCTHPQHLQPPLDLAGGAVSGTLLRPAWERNDGNDVNLDRETTLLARTQSTYSLSASFAQTELRKLYQIIRDGSR